MILTVKELEQYRSICREIEELKIELKTRKQHDTVAGSDSEFPYTKHTMSVSGATSCMDNILLLNHLAKLKREKREIEEFILNIDSSLIRTIFEWRYLKGKRRPSWQFIAFKIEKHDEQYPRKKHKEFIEKLKLYEKDEKPVV